MQEDAARGGGGGGLISFFCFKIAEVISTTTQLHVMYNVH